MILENGIYGRPGRLITVGPEVAVGVEGRRWLRGDGEIATPLIQACSTPRYWPALTRRMFQASASGQPNAARSSGAATVPHLPQVRAASSAENRAHAAA